MGGCVKMSGIPHHPVQIGAAGQPVTGLPKPKRVRKPSVKKAAKKVGK